MGRTLSLLVVLALLGAAPAAAQERPSLRAALEVCSAGPTAPERFAVFTGSMPAHAGTARMWMRFDLHERRSGRGWHRLPAPGFGRWERSKPERAGFVYTKRVEALRQGASYRVVVRFRWYAADGTLQRSASRRTRVCDEPDQRPDLRIVAVDPAEGGGYTVSVVNEGASAAGAFAVALGAQSRVVPGLAADERTMVSVPGDACSPGARLQAVVDPADAVDEADERDNQYLEICSRAP